MEKVIITRTNGIVTQVWNMDPNNASWAFFMGGMSKDVQWHNIDGRECPRIFRDFGEAKWYLDQRKKHLGTLKRRTDDEWKYHILTEVKKDVDHSTD